MLNGSVRTLWGGSNYGYFNNSLITKPDPNQYMKLNHQKAIHHLGSPIKKRIMIRSKKYSQFFKRTTS